MTSRHALKMILRLIFFLIVLTGISWCYLHSNYFFLFVGVIILFILIVEWYRFQNRTYMELGSFIESVKYKDFSRHFNVSKAPAEVRELRKGFNQINEVFKTTSKEKELQYQYLQKILEMVNTGILSYEINSGEVIWMNESLKQMLKLPYLKTIHSLEKREGGLYTEILHLKPGVGHIINLHAERGIVKVLVSATSFHSEGKLYKLMAFQNINEAVDETETKAWQKLLSVMTHEIMNSVAPISSLAGTLKKRLENTSEEDILDSGAVEDLSLGIDTIKKRSEGLLKFAETYRNLNKISKPSLQPLLARDLFENICTLMQPTFDKNGIEVDIILKETNLKIEADPSLIEQVLINLVVNAIEAVKEKIEKKVMLTAERSANQKILIKMSDNGNGMDKDVLEQIFIPFFTTKKNGNGIGLSLCKQIMLLHRGTMDVESETGKGTVFTLQFNEAAREIPLS